MARILILWGIGLLTMVSASVVSLFMRYRHAQYVEREQIKWLLFAGAFFVVVYGLTFFLSSPEALVVGQWFDQPAVRALHSGFSCSPSPSPSFATGCTTLTSSSARRWSTRVLTVLLALVYFGSVMLLQRLFGSTDGRRTIAAGGGGFDAGHRRAVHAPAPPHPGWIDRRFYRKKYDAQQVLAQFALTARDETDLDALTAELAHVVQETMQPKQVSVWLRESK